MTSDQGPVVLTSDTVIDTGTGAGNIIFKEDVSGDHDLTIPCDRVLDLDVLQVRPQHAESVGVRADPALHEVRGIPRQTQPLGPDRLHDVQATLRGVAVDVLFVLVQQDNVMAVGPIRKRRHAPYHLLPMPRSSVANRNEERKHPNVGRAQQICDMQRTIEATQVLVEVIADSDLADR